MLSNTARTELKSDNGGEFGAQWKTQIEAYEPRLKVTHGLASNPNDQALAENAVGRLRTRLRGMRELYNKNFPEYLDKIVAGMNQTPQAPLDYKTPAQLLEAVIEGDADDLELIESVREHQRGKARKRRGVTKVNEYPLLIGQRVRLLDLAYVKMSKDARPN